MPQQPESTSPSLAASPASMPGQAVGFVSGSVLEPETGHASGNGNLQGPDAATGGGGGRQGDNPAPQRIPKWLERAELFLRVLLRMYIGVAVCYAPWSKVFWDQNPLFLHYPTLALLAENGAMRGVISGIGLLNLWVAFEDAFRRSER
jgi:hypothetical protein